MKFKLLTITFFTILLTGSLQAGWLDKAKDLLNESGVTSSGTASSLTDGEISSGLKEALRVGSDLVVNQLGATDGFNADPNIHIPLPNSLKKVQSTLDKVGMSGMLDDLETRLNRAAEIATPKAKELFFNAIQAMTLDDARNILAGENDAATRYFQSKMTPDLVKEFTPIVNDSLAEAGAIKSYDNAIGQYKNLPLVPDAKADLSSYVVEKGMDGIFHYLAVEEAKIRTNPVARTTDLLKKVFAK
ncbi:MAG: DUF4197 domain-containing protein [Gammaproteobacteria bacterium]|nr:DUF4197 domain-containing protein [Gammaproteobacteria bacterium]